MNILVSVNSKFLVPLKVLFYSLYKTQSQPIKIFFFNLSCTDEELLDLQELAYRFNFEFQVVLLPGTDKNLLEQKAVELAKLDLAVETYARLFAPVLLPEIDRALWLDADCLVRQDLNDFYNQDLTGKCVAACDHCFWDISGISIEELPRKNTGVHFNAGVVLFNLELCRKIKGFQYGNIQKVIQEFKGDFFDQGILNLLIPPARVAWANPFDYNMSLNQSFLYGLQDHPIQQELFPKAKILHYCSMGLKPWNLLSFSDFNKRKYWLKDYLELQNFLGAESQKKN